MKHSIPARLTFVITVTIAAALVACHAGNGTAEKLLPQEKLLENNFLLPAIALAHGKENMDAVSQLEMSCYQKILSRLTYEEEDILSESIAGLFNEFKQGKISKAELASGISATLDLLEIDRRCSD